jgi:maltose alpha-D-glucosyltransferase/alpha-amylase
MIGQRLGELHVLLAKPTEDPSFAPRRAGLADVDTIKRSVTGEIAYAFSKLQEIADTIEGPLEDAVRSLLAERDQILDLAARRSEKSATTLLTRAHGDFHLGQILVTEGDAVIIDFEGEPARNLAERRAKTSPLRDAAGLLRSLDYLVATATLENDAVSDHHDERRRQLIVRFGTSAKRLFLENYTHALAGSSNLPSDPQTVQELLDIFLLEKAAYEIAYEARNRPKWLPIPLFGFGEIVSRLQGEPA